MLVCEAIDNYAFDNQKAEGSGNYYANKPIPYSDSNNYQENYSASLVNFTSDDVNDYNSLPVYSSGELKPITNILSGKMIYKDAREKLVFCIKIKEE